MAVTGGARVTARDQATLDSLRVLDFGHRASTAWCARLMADLGAEVIGAEPPDGHPIRSDPAAAAYVLANRRRVDLPAALGLVVEAEVVLTSGSTAETTVDALRPLSGSALIVSITPYGLSSTRSGQPGNDLTAYATSGWASVNGLASLAPLKGTGYNASYQAGTFAWAATMASLLGGTDGEVLDIAERDVLCSTLSPAHLRQQYTEVPEARRQVADITAGPVPVADGYFALTLSRPHFWQSAMRVLGLDDLADMPELQASASRAERKELWAERVQQAMLGWKRMELFDALAAERVIAGPVLDMADLEHNPQLEARRFFRAPDEAPAGSPRQPGPPVRYGRTPWRLTRPAPPGDGSSSSPDTVSGFVGQRLGLGSPSLTRPTGLPAASTVGPLSGYRGLVLTQAWAGAYATELLALLGAEIVQVEARNRLDSWRGLGTSAVPPSLRARGIPGDPWDLNPLFNSVNLNKRSITLDLAEPEGVELFRRLLPRFDFVVENFSPRVMGNLGIAYGDLRAIREDIILVSMSAYGATGPWSPVPGIGGTIEPCSGMSSLLGYVDGPPLNSGHMYPDPVAGLYGFGAVITALAHRRRTGEGQHVDLAMQEACVTFVGDEWMRFQETGCPPARRGNRHPSYAPHGIFACAGDDQWVALAAPDDAVWRSVVGVLGGDELGDERFATAAGRQANETDLEVAISRRTAARDKRELSDALVSAGVIAAPVLDVGEVLADPDLLARGVLRQVAHSLAGDALQAGLPLRIAIAQLPPWSSSPLHGEHSLEVLQQELGLDEETYTTLVAAGITGSGPVKEN
jgi:crotonobetainyl-CoA:carnitine CoA-transferase CaiB-like acyl-CoA transferase